jgi:hypothetical protein
MSEQVRLIRAHLRSFAPRAVSALWLLTAMTLLCAAQSTAPAASPPASPAVGQTTGNSGATQTFFESQMLSYGALDQITAEIAGNICAARPSHLILFDTASFLTVQQYQSFMKEAAVLTSLFNSFSPVEQAQTGVGGPSLQVAEGIFQTLSGVIGASTADKNTTFPISDLAVAMSLSQHLKAAGGCSVGITYPRIAMNQDPDAAAASQRWVTEAVSRLFTAQRRAANAVQVEENRIKDRDSGILGSTGGALPGSSQNAEVNAAFPNPLQVTVKDAAGNVMSGVQVTFTSPASGPSGTFAGGSHSTSVSTNAMGVASASITANGTAGTYTVNANIAGVSSTATFTLTNTSSQPASITAGGTGAAAPASPPGAPPAPPRSIMGSDYLALTGAAGLANQFLSTYGLPSATSGTAPLSGVIAGAQLLSLLNSSDPGTYIVFWEASAAGGTQRDRKNLLTNVFTGDWLSYSGGIVLSFGMIDAHSGQVAGPVVHRLLSPYTTIKLPPKALTDSMRRGSDSAP